MSDSDAETRAAVSALVHRLQHPAEGTDPLGVDAEPFAAEYVAALKARGWRPVLAVPQDADWRRASGKPRGSLDPDVKAALMARMAGASEATRSGTRATGGQPALNDDNDNQEATRGL